MSRWAAVPSSGPAKHRWDLLSTGWDVPKQRQNLEKSCTEAEDPLVRIASIVDPVARNEAFLRQFDTIALCDEALRQEAAAVARVDARFLPSATVLGGMVKWLFALLSEDQTLAEQEEPYVGRITQSRGEATDPEESIHRTELSTKERTCLSVHVNKMMVLCKLFDDAIPLPVLEQSFRLAGVVEEDQEFNDKRLYVWTVIFFGERSITDFLRNLQDLGDLAMTLKGLHFRDSPHRSP